MSKKLNLYHTMPAETYTVCLNPQDGAHHQKYLPEGCPYMHMYPALYILQWFSRNLDVCTQNSRHKFSDIYNGWNKQTKTNVAYTRLKVIASALYLYGLVQRTVMIVFNFNLQMLIPFKTKFVQVIPVIPWAMPPNMAIRDLAFSYIYGRGRVRVKEEKQVIK